MGFIFPSKEWAEEFCRKLNSNEKYRSSAKTWEGSIAFIVRNLPVEVADRLGIKTESIGFVLDLYHGECRGVSWFGDLSRVDAEYFLEATYDIWLKVIRGSISPIAGLVSRRLKVTKGSMAKLMRYTSAALAMVSAAQDVPTDI